MSALVTIEFLQARPGFAGADETTLQGTIDDASALVILECAPYLDDTTDADCPAAIAAVLVSMCRRGTRNPSGNAQETLGDYSYSAGTEGGVPSIYLTARERRIVRRAAGKLGANTTRLDGYLPVQRSELTGVTATGQPDAWDAVTAGTGD